MDGKGYDRLFSGDLEGLVPLPKRVVRLFLSSTFTDMTLERNSLMEHVYPRLKKYCREHHGLDFQVVDMRWGVRDDATDDHQTVNLCSREISNCQRISLGPNFVALIGDKYGFRPLCNKIKSSEYRAIQRCLIELDINTDFIDTWYKEDLNSVPPEYVLQPISSILKNFTNRNEPELQARDQRIWLAIQDRLHELLLIGSRRLVQQGRMSEREQSMKYSISVTEREVIEGCLNVKDIKSHCLVYVRTISDLEHHVDSCLALLAHRELLNSRETTSGDNQQERRDSKARKASLKIGEDVINLTTSGSLSNAERHAEKTRKLIARYIDLRSREHNWEVDREAQDALKYLRRVKLEDKLKSTAKNMVKYAIDWHEQEGISLKCERHKHYLHELNEHFYSNMVRMIRKGSRAEKEVKSGLVGEVLQHSHYAKHVSATFLGRSQELNRIRGYITAPRSKRLPPMFVYGVGGSGKTSLLARASLLAKDWLLRTKTNHVNSINETWLDKPCIVMRFCCTTPSSSTMIGTLTSVCHQLQFNFYQYGAMNQDDEFLRWPGRSQADAQLPYRPVPEDFVRLVFTFRQLLNNCQHRFHRQRMFVIILDSVERLTSPAESSLESKFSWLISITKLPPNVRLIVSCSSEFTNDSWGADYKYLKRHFLKLHLEQEHIRQGRPGRMSNSSSSVSTKSPVEQGFISKVKLVQNQLCFGSQTNLGGSTNAAPGPNDSARELPGVVAKLTEEQFEQDSDEEDRTINGGLLDEIDKNFMAAESALIIHVKPLGLNLALSVMNHCLRDNGRNLSSQQWSIVERSFKSCSRPVFVKLAFGEVVNWKSYSMQSDTKGMTFGASLLKDQSGALEVEPEIQRALDTLNGDHCATGSEFDWQILTMEQQWLSFLDYRSNADQHIQMKTRVDETVIIQIGASSCPPGTGISNGTSALSASICHLSSTIEDAICQLFARIELQHGYILTKHSLSYITAARNGIGENELEDILSLDDVVLDDVFQYHLPPVRRIPPLLWTRIRNDLPDYLSERDADGIVVNWHHSQFKQVTERRYLSDPLQSQYIHSILADYFQGKWSDRAKPFRCTKQQIQMAAEQLNSAVQEASRDSQVFRPRSSVTTNRLASGALRSGVSFSMRSRSRNSEQGARFQWAQAKADRRVAQQPLWYSEQNSIDSQDSLDDYEDSQDSSSYRTSNARSLQAISGKRRRHYNLRKLTELPYHLMRSGRLLDLANGILFNYRWLFAALDSMGLQSLLADFSEARSTLKRALDEALAEPVPPNSITDSGPELELRSIAPPDRLEVSMLRSMIEQLVALDSTLRLSCSAIHSDTQMLAPQLIGRLLPLVERSEMHRGTPGANLIRDHKTAYLAKLLSECDKEGSSDCALLPTDHCLQSPDGMQSSSLEGHSFAIMAIAMAADQRHLLAASNRFIMWDIYTGELSRDVDPMIEGSIMKRLVLGLDNKYALAYTSSNTIIVLEILTQQVSKYCELETLDSQHEVIMGLELVDQFKANVFVVWTSKQWFTFSISRSDREQLVEQSVTINLDYCFRLDEIGTQWNRVLSVKQVRSASGHTDLAFVELALEGDVNEELDMVTLEIANQGDRLWSIKRQWAEPIRATSSALDPLLSQLVFANKYGDIYLSRRRAAHWSQPKLIWKRETDTDGSGIMDQEVLLSPLAIELGVQKSSGAYLETLALYDFSHELELAHLERQIDGIESNDEIQGNYVFDGDSRVGSDESTSDARSARKRDLGLGPKLLGVKFVKIYYPSSIVIVYLDPKASPKTRRLNLPRSIRNISVKLNHCQMRSIILSPPENSSPSQGSCEGDHLIACAGKKLLFFSLKDESLLSCVDAHNARIVELIQTRRNTGPHASGDLGGTESQLYFASASLDKTVKVWNLANLNKGTRALDKLGSSIESISLAGLRPLAACLGRGELGIFDWREPGRMLAKFTEANLGETKRDGSRLIATKFSSNGRHLAIASTKSISLLSIPSSFGRSRSNKSSKLDVDPSKLVFKDSLPVGSTVVKLEFFNQDARLMIVLQEHEADLDQALLIRCLSVPDGRQMFTIHCLTPFLQTELTQAVSSLHTNGPQSSSGYGGLRRIRKPIITRDHLFIVVATPVSASDGSLSEKSHGEGDRLRGPNVRLSAFSTRDGSLVRQIDLGRLEVYDPAQSEQPTVRSSRASLKEVEEADSHHQPPNPRFGTKSSNETRTKTHATIADSFSQLKAINLRERPSIVALLDRDKGTSFLIDVNTKQLLATSGLWNGKVSADGRHGLSWIFRSGASRQSGSVAGSAQTQQMTTSGLQMLEMRRCSPIKQILSIKTLGRLIGQLDETGHWSTSGSDTDVTSGFTKPNDFYIYVHEARLKRLLLIRTRDGRLLANYKLSGQLTKLKCSHDGLTLILGMADGSLTSLAIVDPENSDSLAHLAALPSRARNPT